MVSHMKLSCNNLYFAITLLSIVACNTSSDKKHGSENDGWIKIGQVEKTIRNIHFTFPDSGFAYDNREDLLEECFNALETDSDLIGLKEYNDFIFIRFLRSREEMFPLTGTRALGNAYPHNKTLYVVSNETVKSPIKHELMHLISMLEWDYPETSSNWMNEGLGTFAENDCSGWNVSEIYRYLLETDQLLSMESLTTDFYGQPEMLSYHQSGYLVEYLLKNYGIERFSKLWKGGFGEFERIYGLPFEMIKDELEKELLVKYPKSPKIDQDTFNNPCR